MLYLLSCWRQFPKIYFSNSLSLSSAVPSLQYSHFFLFNTLFFNFDFPIWPKSILEMTRWVVSVACTVPAQLWFGSNGSCLILSAFWWRRCQGGWLVVELEFICQAARSQPSASQLHLPFSLTSFWIMGIHFWKKNTSWTLSLKTLFYATTHSYLEVWILLFPIYYAEFSKEIWLSVFLSSATLERGMGLPP